MEMIGSSQSVNTAALLKGLMTCLMTVEGLGCSHCLQATEADNANRDPGKLSCHCLPVATSCCVITGESGSGTDH